MGDPRAGKRLAGMCGAVADFSQCDGSGRVFASPVTGMGAGDTRLMHLGVFAAPWAAGIVSHASNFPLLRCNLSTAYPGRPHGDPPHDDCGGFFNGPARGIDRNAGDWS